MELYGRVLKWKQTIQLANILLLLARSSLASISTQLCSDPRIHKEPKNKTNEKQQKEEKEIWLKLSVYFSQM